MDSPDLTQRAGIVRASLQQVRREAQQAGSGATIHTLTNRISTAHAVLIIVETRATSVPSEQLVELMDLADASLRDARALIAQLRPSGPQQPTKPGHGTRRDN